MGHFDLLSMATSGNQIEEAAEYAFVPFAQKDAISRCVKLFHIPNMSEWCPLTLMDIGSLSNYYTQQVNASICILLASRGSLFNDPPLYWLIFFRLSLAVCCRCSSMYIPRCKRMLQVAKYDLPSFTTLILFHLASCL